MDEVALKSASFSPEAHWGIRSVLQHFMSRHERRDRKRGGPAAAAAGMMSLLVRGRAGQEVESSALARAEGTS
jgi:hypothetical protein